MTDLHIARRLGWTYADVLELPASVYWILRAELVAEQEAAGAGDEDEG